MSMWIQLRSSVRDCSMSANFRCMRSAAAWARGECTALRALAAVKFFFIFSMRSATLSLRACAALKCALPTLES